MPIPDTYRAIPPLAGIHHAVQLDAWGDSLLVAFSFQNGGLASSLSLEDSRLLLSFRPVNLGLPLALRLGDFRRLDGGRHGVASSSRARTCSSVILPTNTRTRRCFTSKTGP